MNPEMQVSATESALALIELIKSRHGDDLLFHQSLPQEFFRNGFQNMSNPNADCLPQPK